MTSLQNLFVLSLNIWMGETLHITLEVKNHLEDALIKNLFGK